MWWPAGPVGSRASPDGGSGACGVPSSTSAAGSHRIRRPGRLRRVVRSEGRVATALAPADAAAIAQKLIADPNFETTAPVAHAIGGLKALSIDVALAPGGKACGIGMIEIGSWIHALGWEPGLRLRLYLVDPPDGMSVETLAITVVAPEERFEEVIVETAPVIELIEIHPG